MESLKRINLKSFCAYWPYPPIGGGPSRIYNLNNSISKEVNITQYSFRPTNSSKIFFKNLFFPNTLSISNNYQEVQYLNIPCLSNSYLLSKVNLPHDIFQSTILRFLGPNVDFTGDLLQIEHPWLFNYVFRNNKKNLPMILTAHNYEYNLCEDLIFKKAPYFKSLLKNIRKLELEALKKSDVVFSVSPRDIDQFIENGIDESKIHLVPNGVDISKFSATSDEEKELLKEKYGFSGKKIVLFTGTIHYPNIEAVGTIEKIAKQFDNSVIFLVIGKAGNGFKSKDNFICQGFVEDILDYIKMADIGINPLISGSGTNLKMLEYLSSGLPTVTTPIGARGLDLEDGKNVLISNIDDMPETLNLLLDDEILSSNLRKNGRELVEKEYDWNVIGNKMIGIYKDLVI
jgi:glycosyltransferase involved in cell wall biosynthesis